MTKNRQTEKKIPAIILSAGFSSRMAMHKMLLPFGNEETFLSQLISVYEDYGCSEVLIVVNPDGEASIRQDFELPENVKVIKNLHPEWPKFYSLQLACEQLKGADAVYVQNIDNPYTNADVLTVLEKASERADYILPEFEKKGGHPFLISSRVIHEIITHPNSQEHLKYFLQQFKHLRIPVQDQKILANINTPEAYLKWFKEPVTTGVQRLQSNSGRQ